MEGTRRNRCVRALPIARNREWLLVTTDFPQYYDDSAVERVSCFYRVRGVSSFDRSVLSEYSYAETGYIVAPPTNVTAPQGTCADHIRIERFCFRIEGTMIYSAGVLKHMFDRLRNRRFTSIEQLNEAIRDLLEAHNNKPFQKLPYSRRDLYERIERYALKPLPAERFPMQSIQIATVQYNYHVHLEEDLHYYSVPWFLYRANRPKTKVKIVYDDRVVAIYYDYVRIAEHHRDRTPNGYTTCESHMPDEHRVYAKWNRDRFIGWATSMGDDVRRVITTILDRAGYPQQAYKTCMGILNLAKIADAKRLNKACARALSFGSFSYTRIKNILERGLEEERQPQLDLQMRSRRAHENVRGSHYFR